MARSRKHIGVVEFDARSLFNPDRSSQEGLDELVTGVQDAMNRCVADMKSQGRKPNKTVTPTITITFSAERVASDA